MTHISGLEIKVMDFEILCLSFSVKDFRSLYHLKFKLTVVDTLPDIRYYSTILWCIIPTCLLALRSGSWTLKIPKLKRDITPTKLI